MNKRNDEITWITSFVVQIINGKPAPVEIITSCYRFKYWKKKDCNTEIGGIMNIESWIIYIVISMFFIMATKDISENPTWGLIIGFILSTFLFSILHAFYTRYLSKKDSIWWKIFQNQHFLYEGEISYIGYTKREYYRRMGFILICAVIGIVLEIYGILTDGH